MSACRLSPRSAQDAGLPLCENGPTARVFGAHPRQRWTVVLALALLGLSPKAPRALLIVPMDGAQTDHLRAYGVAYHALMQGTQVEWLLNYRGGSFLMDRIGDLEIECRLRGVHFERLDPSGVEAIRAEMSTRNMESVVLEKAPSVAIYIPPTSEPWDDAVTLALTYAEIPYTSIWDEDVLGRRLQEFDWVHLHHEDFTGQYGKFYSAYGQSDWYRRRQQRFEEAAREAGFTTVANHKGAVAAEIRDYVVRGGFLFAMCSATETLDLALACLGVDIVDVPYDGDPPEAGWSERIDCTRTMAFDGFSLITDPMVYEFSDIDTSNLPIHDGPTTDYFELFEFSAKEDPILSLLVQNHTRRVTNFMGQTTGFRRDRVKPGVVILAETVAGPEVKYLHGTLGQGTFTFLGGHDPEDYHHLVGDPPTELALHKHSPGYRLILNNILFPAARRRERKT